MAYCDRCERSFPHDRALQQHEEDSSNHWPCYDCQMDFPTEWGREQHYIQSPRHHYCRKCEREFSSMHALQNHCRDKHHYCSDCNKLFENEYGLDQHYSNSSAHQVSDSDSDTEAEFYCEDCDRRFASQSNLRSHLQSSTHRSKNIICPGCKGGYISPSALVAHLESGNCQSGVDRQAVNRRVRELDTNNIITDRLLTNGESGNRSFKYVATGASWNGDGYGCYLCTSTFRSLNDLNRHLNSPRHESKIYICFMSDCRARFPTLSGLIQHIESERCDALKSRVLRSSLKGITTGMKRLAM